MLSTNTRSESALLSIDQQHRPAARLCTAFFAPQQVLFQVLEHPVRCHEAQHCGHYTLKPGGAASVYEPAGRPRRRRPAPHLLLTQPMHSRRSATS